jgi:MYXO-CTERM domain-containing protein
VCCNAACDGQCEVCSDAGLCSPVTGDPQAGRAACSGDPKVCGGSCDGQTRDACTYPSSAQSCGNSCSEGQQLPSVCDSAGACVESTPISCGNYACGESECLTACSAGRDCAAGFSCAGSQCKPTGSKCSEDLLSSVSEDKVATLCAPYVCDASSGECKTACTNIDDCASGSVCNASKSCVPATNNKSSDSGGCGCSVPAARTSWDAWLLLAGVLGLLRRRVKRSCPYRQL